MADARLPHDGRDHRRMSRCSTPAPRSTTGRRAASTCTPILAISPEPVRPAQDLHCTTRAGPRPRRGARPASSSAAPSRRSSEASRSRSSCPSATSTARSARCSATRSPRRYRGDGLPDEHHPHPPHAARPGRASAPSCRAASRCASRATPTTTLGKGLSGGRLVVRPRSTRTRPFVAEDNIIAGNVIALRRHRRRGLPARHRRRALLRPQLRRHRGGRGRGRPRLRVHDRWPRRRARPRPAATSRAGMSGGIALRLRPGRHVLPPGQRRDGRRSSRSTTTTCEWLRDTPARATVERRPAPPSAAQLLDALARRGRRFRKVMPLDYKRVLEALASPKRPGSTSTRPSTGQPRDRVMDEHAMGDVDGVPQVGSRDADAPAGAGALARLAGGLRARSRDEQPADAGGAVHGLRHPVLQQRLPARQPDPRLERPRLPRPLARRRSTGCTPPTTSRSSPGGCARRRARRRACSASTRTRSRSSRSRSSIIDRAWDEGWVAPARAAGHAPASASPSSAPGPPGLAAAQQLTRAGHDVVVFERADRIGGLLRYGIPEFKMEKRHLDRRIEQMRGRGHRVPRRTCDVGVDVDVDELPPRSTTPSCWPAAPPRGATCRCPAASSTASTRRWSSCPGPTGCRRATSRRRRADHRRRQATSIIIGGGDTGADCLGTSHRHGAASVTQLEILPRPPDDRAADNPWPTYADGLPGRRRPTRRAATASTASTPSASSATTTAACGPCACTRSSWSTASSRRSRAPTASCPAELVLLAMGFLGREQDGLLEQLGVELDPRGNVARDDAVRPTSVPGVFVAGDMGRGQSLIVWAIAEGRACAAAVDRYLMGETQPPRPIPPMARPPSEPLSHCRGCPVTCSAW